MQRRGSLAGKCQLVTALSLAVLTSACSQRPPANTEVSVPAVRDVDTRGASEREAESYSRFLARFLTVLEGSGATPAALDSFVDPQHGVLLLINPGALTYVFHYPNYRALAHSEYLGPQPLGGDMQCHGELIERSGRLPQMDCETERYDVSESCYQGQFRSGVLRQHVVWAQEHMPPETPDDGARFTRLMAAVERTEPFSTHYFYSTRAHRGYFFGQVSGAWRLLWVDAVSPCSA